MISTNIIYGRQTLDKLYRTNEVTNCAALCTSSTYLLKVNFCKMYFHTIKKTP